MPLRENICFTRLNKLVTNEGECQCLTTLRFVSSLPQISYEPSDPLRQLPTIQGLMNQGFLYLVAPPSQHMACRPIKEGEEKKTESCWTFSMPQPRNDACDLSSESIGQNRSQSPTQLQRRMDLGVGRAEERET